MKVAIIQEHVDSRRGGSETSTLEMAGELVRLGVDVNVVCRGSTGPDVQGVKLAPIPAAGWSRALRTYQFVQGARAFCRREPFDIVHAITPCLAANVYQPRGGTYPETIERSLARVRSPAVRGIKRLGRRFNIRQRFLQRVEDLLLRKYAPRLFVAAVSDYVRRQVELGFGFPASRIRVVFNGVQIDPLTEAEAAEQRAARRAELQLGPQDPLLLFVAHNFKLKGLGELIRATADAIQSGMHAWTVVVLGRDAPGRDRVLARRCGVERQIRFVGAASSTRQWYAAADALAHPTWYDPCSRVVLEALSVGLPVVTTRYNGAAEVMQPGRHGEVVDEPDDIPALAAALNRVLSPAVRAACRADAARLRAQLSMARHARDLLACYEVVLASAR